MIRPLAMAAALSALTIAVEPAQPASCPQFFPGGQPPALTNPRLSARTTLLCNDAYAALASGVTHGPLWSAEHLTAASVAAARTMHRESTFHPDDRLPPADRAELQDYARSGYDRGHMAPSGDMPNDRAQQQSYALSNIVPQTSALNRGVWDGIEIATRDLAALEGEVYVVTGPAYQGGELQAIGPDGVLVPTGTWKAVYDPHAGDATAYLCANTAQPTCATMAIAALTRAVGIDPFPALPKAMKEALR